ncbi:38907_t:CDS:2 [Gigaspora margarita]|uniref:38907_t:CDS:1 n=1 Tax=Gigaspora margarita TaxID=4874 RepID=A0ABN7UZW0_GIGMA|nr:38907_t:CDS:2 [Gigaspora margarita]
MTKNIKKGTPEWEKEIIALIGKEINKEFTKGQKKPDGTEVTAEKETIKVNDTQILLKEIKEQKKIVEEKLNSLAQKKGYKAHQRFLKGGTDGYGTEQKYAKPNATSLTETYDSNLYQGTFRMGELGNSHTAFRITENEVVKLMARVVKELGKIKKTEFDAYVNGLGKAKLADGT